MARIVKEKEHTVKRNEILDVAQRLVYTKGYAQMSIQDILDDLQISKGAFYHYYDSKQALLAALSDRLIEQAEEIITPIVNDPHLSALEKFQRYFDTVARWKTAQKDFLLALLRVWYTDDNAVVRQKVTSIGLKRITPLLTKIIRQGIQEGVLTTTYPDRVCEVIFSMMLGMSDTLAEIILDQAANENALSRLESTIGVYTTALEQVLGAPIGSLRLIDAESLKEWIVPPPNNDRSKVKVQSSRKSKVALN